MGLYIKGYVSRQHVAKDGSRYTQWFHKNGLPLLPLAHVPGTPNTWVFTQPFKVSDIPGFERYGDVEIHVGFETDLASTPWFVRGIFPQAGRYLEGAAIHDFMYYRTTHIYKKKVADVVFRDITIAYKTKKWVADLFYFFVKTFGKGGW